MPCAPPRSSHSTPRRPRSTTCAPKSSGVSFAIEPGHAAYVPLHHTYPGAPQQLNRDEVLRLLQPLLEDDNRPKLGHDLKYDAHVLRNHGIELRGMRFDSMLESYVLNSTATRHDLDPAAQRYLGVETIHYETVAGRGAKQLSFNDVPVEAATEYSAEDSDVALRLHRTLWPRLAAEPSLARLYRRDRAAAGAGAARHGALRCTDRRADAAPAERRAGAGTGRAGASRARGSGPAIQRRIAETAAGSAVRQARPARQAQDALRSAFDG